MKKSIFCLDTRVYFHMNLNSDVLTDLWKCIYPHVSLCMTLYGWYFAGQYELHLFRHTRTIFLTMNLGDHKHILKGKINEFTIYKIVLVLLILNWTLFSNVALQSLIETTQQAGRLGKEPWIFFAVNSISGILEMSYICFMKKWPKYYTLLHKKGRRSLFYGFVILQWYVQYLFMRIFAENL